MEKKFNYNFAYCFLRVRARLKSHFLLFFAPEARIYYLRESEIFELNYPALPAMAHEHLFDRLE